MTRNLACSPAASTWAVDQAALPDAPSLMFLQEVPAGLPPIPGYTSFTNRAAVVPPGRRPKRSAVLVRDELAERCETATDRPLHALGTYAAAIRITTPDGPVHLASVHASPSRVPAEDLESQRSRCDLEAATRSCEAGPWWSDVVAAALVRLADRPFVAAGDYNQALAYDQDIGHRCGGEFFSLLAAHDVTDAVAGTWGGERATRHSPTRPSPDYHLDRVLISGSAQRRAQVDDIEPVFDGASDHAPVWFRLDL